MNNQLSFRIQEAGLEVYYDPPRNGDCFYHAAACQLGSSCEAAKNGVFEYLKSNRLNVGQLIYCPNTEHVFKSFCMYMYI